MAERDVEVHVPVDHHEMTGTLAVPDRAEAIVVFAHGSGSTRFSPRNRYVAATLRSAGFATLLLDLLTPAEESADAITGHLRFDIDLLAARVEAVTDWLATQQVLRALRIGYFGASTGAAAALIAAADRPSSVAAVVSRGGRPDLAGAALGRVSAPTLLIVGARDFGVIELNEEALARLASPHKELRLVPEATHLFEEPGALNDVARLASRWFEQFLAPAVRYSPAPEQGA